MAVFRILLQNWKPFPNLISRLDLTTTVLWIFIIIIPFRIIHPTNIGVCANPSFQSVCKYSVRNNYYYIYNILCT